MAEPSYKKVTEAEEMKIREYIKSGMPLHEIKERTGRVHNTIYRIRNKMREEEETQHMNDETVVQNIEEPKTEPSIAESDYAKGYLAGDPRNCHSNLEVEKRITIRSRKTGYQYEVTKTGESMSITKSDGQMFEVSISDLEKFADELIDVTIEIASFRKK